MNFIALLFWLGVMLLVLHFVVFFARAALVQHRGRQLLRHGTLPRPQADQPDRPYNSAGLFRASEAELAVLGLLFVVMAIDGLLTGGIWGLASAGLGVAILLFVGPAISAWWWAANDSDDGLAKVCHKLLTWALACFTIPLLSILG